MLKFLNKYRGLNVLLFLVISQGQKYSINCLSKILKLSPRHIETTCKNLYSEGVLSREIIGNSHAYIVNPDHRDIKLLKKIAFPYLLMSEEIISALKKKKVLSAYLYGGCADGTFNSKSDVDLFLLTTKKLDYKDIAELSTFLYDKFKRKIQIVSYGVDDIPRLKRTPFYKEIKNGINIYGEEI